MFLKAGNQRFDFATSFLSPIATRGLALCDKDADFKSMNYL